MSEKNMSCENPLKEDLQKKTSGFDSQEGQTILTHARAVEALVNIFEVSSLTEMEYQCSDVRVRLFRGGSGSFSPPTVFTHGPVSTKEEKPLESKKQEEPAPEVKKGVVVPSPLVGTAYLTPKPDAEPFVKVGDKVEVGQILLIVEAMKVMNPIKSSLSGHVVEICVKNGMPVEYDQPLLYIA